VRKVNVITTAVILTFMLTGVAESSWEMSTDVSYIEYKEPDVMKQQGMMFGTVVEYEYQGGLPVFSEEQENRISLNLEGKISAGVMDYSSPRSGNLDNIADVMFEVRGLGGYDFYLTDSIKATPYAGLGYRYLNDDSSGKISSVGHAGYERESNYLYSPIGVELTKSFDSGWSVGFQCEYDFFWLGRQKSHLGDIVGYSDVTNKQKEGYGVRGTFFVKKPGQKYDYVIESYIKYWNIDKSEVAGLVYNNAVIGTAWEPQNNSREIGVKLGVKF